MRTWWLAGAHDRPCVDHVLHALHRLCPDEGAGVSKTADVPCLLEPLARPKGMTEEVRDPHPRWIISGCSSFRS